MAFVKNVLILEPIIHCTTEYPCFIKQWVIIRSNGAGAISTTKQTKNLENFIHWKYELSRIGFEIAEYSCLKIFKKAGVLFSGITLPGRLF